METILVAENEPITRALIQHRLERAGFRIITVQNGREAVEKTKEILPSLVLLELIMPEMDGLEACRLIKDDETTRDVSIIFLSSREETEITVSALSLGASDYIKKPFKAEELLARIWAALRDKGERDSLRASVEQYQAYALMAQRKAMTDALTGLLNRYGLDHMLAQKYTEARANQSPLCCLLIDIDWFKTINDTYGHMAGDLAIKQVAILLHRHAREDDVACRYGGEEFLILMLGVNLKEAVLFAEGIRMAAMEQRFGKDGQFHLTLSIGTAELSDDELGLELVARADTALYRAKQNGRNRVEVSVTEQDSDVDDNLVI